MRAIFKYFGENMTDTLFSDLVDDKEPATEIMCAYENY